MLVRVRQWFARRKLTHTPFHEFDGFVLRASDPLGNLQLIAISEILEVAIETNSLGPFVEDVFWRVNSDSEVIRVPQSSPVFTVLMEHFESLESFDWEAFSRSMGCTDDALFLCWKRGVPDKQKRG